MSILFALVLAAVVAWFVLYQLRRSRRHKLFTRPLPPDMVRFLETNVPLYSMLPPDLREALHGRINVFLDEKEFIGCGGLEITDEIRITIAGNASILLLGRDRRCFPGFTSILVYPDTYIAKEINYEGLVEIHEDSARAGESWQRGPVVLSWADVLHDTSEQDDGHNVVLHEFAHKLDEENEIMDGLPVLRDSTHYRKWAEILSREYVALQSRVERGADTVLDEYGAFSPPEFFAVATETFFEQPRQMKNRLPELYEQLKIFYNLDPAAWRKWDRRQT